MDGQIIDHITEADLQQDFSIKVRLHRVKIIEGIKELVDVILLDKKPVEKRKIRTRVLAKMHDFTRKVTLWASKTPFDRSVVQKHQAALESAKKVEAETTSH